VALFCGTVFASTTNDEPADPLTTKGCGSFITSTTSLFVASATIQKHKNRMAELHPNRSQNRYSLRINACTCARCDICQEEGLSGAERIWNEMHRVLVGESADRDDADGIVEFSDQRLR
jgi:hypothetical protein